MVKIPKLKEKRRYGAGSLGMGGELSSAQGVGLQHVGKILGDVTSKLASAYFAHKQTETNTFTKQASTLYQAKAETLRTQIQNDPRYSKDPYKAFQEQIVPLREAFREELKKEADNGSISFDGEDYIKSNKMLLDTIDKAVSIPLMKTSIGKISRNDQLQTIKNHKLSNENLIGTQDYSESKYHARNFKQIKDTLEAQAFEGARSLWAADRGMSKEDALAYEKSVKEEEHGLGLTHGPRWTEYLEQVTGENYGHKAYLQELKSHASTQLKKRLGQQVSETFSDLNQAKRLQFNYLNKKTFPKWLNNILNGEDYKPILKDFGISGEDLRKIMRNKANEELSFHEKKKISEELEFERSNAESFSQKKYKYHKILGEMSLDGDSRKLGAGEAQDLRRTYKINVNENSSLKEAKDEIEKSLVSMSSKSGGRLKFKPIIQGKPYYHAVEESNTAVATIYTNIEKDIREGKLTLEAGKKELDKFNRGEGDYGKLIGANRKQVGGFLKAYTSKNVIQTKKDHLPRLMQILTRYRKLDTKGAKYQVNKKMMKKLAGLGDKAWDYALDAAYNGNISAEEMIKTINKYEYGFYEEVEKNLIDKIKDVKGLDGITAPIQIGETEKDKDKQVSNWARKNLAKLKRSQELELGQLKNLKGNILDDVTDIMSRLITLQGTKNTFEISKLIDRCIKREELIKMVEQYEDHYGRYAQHAPQSKADTSQMAESIERNKNRFILQKENTEKIEEESTLATE